MQRKIILSVFIFYGANLASAQSNGTSQKATPAPADSSLNSLSIFQLIDSLVQSPDAFQLGSTLVARLGYNSNVVAASRTIGFNQFGLSPGLSYYHKSGLYLDASTYWSQEYSPNTYLTVPSAGYLKTTGKWTLNVEYSRYIYTFTDSAYNFPYTNTAGISNFFNVKPFLFRFDYSLYFGQKSAHRLMPGVMLNLEKKNWHGFTRILLYPTFNVLLGNETWQITQYVPNFTNQAGFLQQKPPRFQQVVNNYNKFGVLNYSVVLPLSVSVKNWTFLASYTYNFQQVLPDEPIALTNSGYLSFSIVRCINFKSNSLLTDLLKMTK